ncbi:hypothetical protein RB195_009682 [Necator americanus]|uniref:Reverse transcriptase domain-containing protein n=1 Tax=Necator americanus TaxID=51031 RepID=A0ABR1CUE3_NECAM
MYSDPANPPSHRKRLLSTLPHYLIQPRKFAGFTASFEVETGVRQWDAEEPFPFNLAVDDIMRRTVRQCPADVILAPSSRHWVDLEYADDVVIFSLSSAKLQIAVVPVSY